jgi:hypothetical protein
MNPRDLLAMSLGAILTNKLRSALTLLGIVAGVASIISVMTAISLVQATLEQEMSVLGAQTFQVQKWPAGPSSEAERRKAMRRPPLTLANADAIRGNVPPWTSWLRDLGLRVHRRVSRRDHEPEPVDRRRHARVPGEQHALRGPWPQPVAARHPRSHKGGRDRLRDREEAVPVRGPDRPREVDWRFPVSVRYHSGWFRNGAACSIPSGGPVEKGWQNIR